MPLIPIPLFSYFRYLRPSLSPTHLLPHSPNTVPVLTWTIAVQPSCTAKIILKSLLLHVQCTLYALPSMVFESAHEHSEHTCTYVHVALGNVQVEQFMVYA